MSEHVVVIGSGAVGAMSAVAALEQGFTVTLLEPEDAGGEQAASYGNATLLSSHSVLPPSEPGIWKKVPGYLLDPLGPLSIRPAYFPRAIPWLTRYLLSGLTIERVERIARALRPLLFEAPQLHAAVAAKAGLSHLIDTGCGVLHLYESRAGYEAEPNGWRIRREAGIALEELEGEALRALEPRIDPKYGFAVFVREAGQCRNPGEYVAGLAAHVASRGGRLERQRATGFRIEAGRLKAVVTDRGDIPCDKAVIAAGVRSKALAAAAGDRVSLDSEAGYHVVLKDPPAVLKIPVMLAREKAVVAMTNAGLRVAGQVEIGGLDAPDNWKRAEILKKHLLSLFPALGEDIPADRFRVWKGHRPSTPDGMPCIGHATGSRDIVHAFGHGHIGLVSSARTGRVVAQLLAEMPPEIPVEPFSPRRF